MPVESNPPNQESRHTGGLVTPPPSRRLRGYAFDPSLSSQLETMMINETVFSVPWENLQPGPVGEYIEVVDYDPASRCFYQPINLDDLNLLAQDGLQPSVGNPQFHQQMVYGVAMTTIYHFEEALGRKVIWEPHWTPGDESSGEYVQRLRIYPHALREANAYYSPAKKSLLFGYFPAINMRLGGLLPGGNVFTCLSHDVVAHETTHALLDSMYKFYIENTHRDTLAFHEAFADIVALFQHFSYPEVLRHQIAKTRGDLSSQSLLGELAQEFGRAIGNYGALRNAIGRINPETGRWEQQVPEPRDYETVIEPHARGAILVATVFDAFLAIYKSRVEDLFRLATGGTGVLPAGAIHPDLVNRLASEAAKAARTVLRICIRALDYCPPVDINFGDYLRALITADADVVPSDERSYRVAIIEAFNRRGIYPQGVRSLSVEGLRWHDPYDVDVHQQKAFKQISQGLNKFAGDIRYIKDRKKIFQHMRGVRTWLHQVFSREFKDYTELEALTGLAFSPTSDLPGLRRNRDGSVRFSVHSLVPALRYRLDGSERMDYLIFSLVQTRDLSLDEQDPFNQFRRFRFRGGCTLILDLNAETDQLKFCITKPINDEERLARQKDYLRGMLGSSLALTYFGAYYAGAFDEPFALMHRSIY